MKIAVASAKGTFHIFELSALSAATRAELKIEFPGETIVAISFMSRNTICAAFNGEFNEGNKEVSVEKTQSLFGTL